MTARQITARTLLIRRLFLGQHMWNYIIRFMLIIALFTSAQLFAADSSTACSKYPKGSEFSWNPSNQFVTARLSRFYNLNSLIDAAYKAKDFRKVRELAKENLALAAVYRCNWNYGNAIYDTNRILGLISLKDGDVNAAVSYLLQAGKSPGSPQLDTFGPNLDLANELLKRGQVTAVTAYLHEIRSFWTMDSGQIANWLSQIKKGKKPELDRFAAHEPGPLLLFIGWLLMVWPLVVSVSLLYARRKRIKKKIIFLIIAVLSGYTAIYLGGRALDYGIAAILTGSKNLSEVELNLLNYIPFVLMFLLPALAALVEARFFYSEAKD